MKFKFLDLDSKKYYTIKATNPDIAIIKMNKKAGYRVNYSFLKKF